MTKETVTTADLAILTTTNASFAFDVLGLEDEKGR
jgi:hypothetical protein